MNHIDSFLCTYTWCNWCDKCRLVFPCKNPKPKWHEREKLRPAMLTAQPKGSSYDTVF